MCSTTVCGGLFVRYMSVLVGLAVQYFDKFSKILLRKVTPQRCDDVEKFHVVHVCEIQ